VRVSFSLPIYFTELILMLHRVFLCASSPDESGQEALDWALESFVQDGDEFVVFRGVEEDVFEKDHDLIRDSARSLMAYIQSKSASDHPQRKLSIVLEYVPGKVTDTLDRLIALYRCDYFPRFFFFQYTLIHDVLSSPDSVIVGISERKAWQIGKGAMGSVSKYCLRHSPVGLFFFMITSSNFYFSSFFSTITPSFHIPSVLRLHKYIYTFFLFTLFVIPI
jgi:hypothetical protein